MGSDERIDNLEKEMLEFIDNVNKRFEAISIILNHLDAKIEENSKKLLEMEEKDDGWNTR